MGAIANILRRAMEGLLMPFDWLGAFWGLTVLSLLCGVVMLWVVGKTTPQKLVARARNRMDSAIYEIRLFIDSPKWVVLSIGRLISNSCLYIGAMLPAFVILALPIGAMYFGLETRHGMKELPTNTPLVVTVQLAEGTDGNQLTVEVPNSLEMTAPPMYVRSENRVYLRVESREPVRSTLRLRLGDKEFTKELVADPEATQMAPDRASGADLFFSYGPEHGLDGEVMGISVRHEARDTSYLGIPMPWWLWWLLLMMIAAFGLRKRMNVTI